MLAPKVVVYPHEPKMKLLAFILNKLFPFLLIIKLEDFKNSNNYICHCPFLLYMLPFKMFTLYYKTL